MYYIICVDDINKLFVFIGDREVVNVYFCKEVGYFGKCLFGFGKKDMFCYDIVYSDC